MDKYKQTADSYLAVSEGAPDPVIWFENVMKVERESLLKANVKNQELTKKIASLEKERNDSVVKNAKIEKSILDAKKQAESATKGEKYSIFYEPVPMKFLIFFFIEMKKAVASDGKARAEAERCRKMSNQAIKEHATMKEQYTMNVTKLKWLENKLQVESEALGKLVKSSRQCFRDSKFLSRQGNRCFLVAFHLRVSSSQLKNDES